MLPNTIRGSVLCLIIPLHAAWEGDPTFGRPDLVQCIAFHQDLPLIGGSQYEHPDHSSLWRGKTPKK